jgi:hypothetical protein
MKFVATLKSMLRHRQIHVHCRHVCDALPADMNNFGQRALPERVRSGLKTVIMLRAS